MICTWCRESISEGKEYFLTRKKRAMGFVYCSYGCINTHTAYCSDSGVPIKPLPENTPTFSQEDEITSTTNPAG